MASNLSAQTPIGNLQSQFERDGNTVLFSGENADLQLEFYTPSMVRVQTSWDRSFETVGKEWMLVDNHWPQVDVSVEEAGEEVRFKTDDLVVSVQKEPLKLTFLTPSGTVLNTEEISQSSGGMMKKGEAVWVEKKLLPEEHFFGFGERMDFVDQRGKKIELDVGRGTGPTHTVGAYNILKANYSPVPFFMSTRGYGIFFHTPYTTHWDMGNSDTNVYSFKAENGQIDYFFMYGPEFPAILDQYTDLTGKSPLVPEFTLGLNVGTYSGGTWGHEGNTSDDYVINLGRKFKEKGIPADVLHLDSTWRIFGPNGYGSTTFEWRNTFKNPEAMFDSLYAMDYNMVGVHVRPRYDNGNKYNLLDQAREAGVVYPEPGGGEFVNVFDSVAVDWWWEHGARIVIEQGAMFFKTDEGSAFGNKANESDKTGPTGPEAKRLHNLFPLAYTSAPFTRFQDENNMRGFNLTREGYAGIQRYPYIWAGDWSSEWQYFEPVIRAGLNIGLSGVGFWSHNMGGFEHVPDPELYIRWVQFGMFSPIAHLFGMDHPGYKEPWSYGEQAERIFKKYDRMRYRMIPYIYSEAWKMHNTGKPIMRALVLEYQDDINTYDIDDQYMFGDNLLVAPVTTKGAKTRTVYLPEGTWYDYWNGEKYSGKQHVAYLTPLDKLPIFVKAGGIIPQRNRIENLGEQPADTLSLEIFPHGQSSYEIYDDDGKSREYESGEYAITTVTVDDQSLKTTVNIQAPEGSYQVPERSYKLLIHTKQAPESVQEDSRVLSKISNFEVFQEESQEDGWYFDEESGKLFVRLSGSSAEDINVTISK
ncbi:glycoside hydrolase family 31 protein [Gracilimonas mengyeensis]|uniref:Alpha-glucosidase, glycosyl hydrolase family GH31 n=1 Tax=Gracilimonas mengyeensis TaxID=1302730 RepID=A0A521C393_9BACT|nr:TIM-barrel domain-containing protein [Gracilimonas mengyeensis]SMO53957.1 Alpha-glucosidase, glycosyl hydrolase family GH31 [Gracilimonas mengyeensis]